MEGGEKVKNWYKSKRFWVNIIGLAIAGAEYAGKVNWVSYGTLAVILGILNIILSAVSTQAVDVPVVSDVLKAVSNIAKPPDTPAK